MDGESFRTKLSGVTHSNADGTERQALVKACRPGQRLELRREPDNAHDPYAIAVHSDAGMLGYLHGGDRKLATHLDRGGQVTITVSEVTGGPTLLERLLRRSGKFYGCNVLIEKHAPDWQAVRPWMEANREIDQLVKAAHKAEKVDPDKAVSTYREAIGKILALDTDGPQASAWRTTRYPINRLSLTLERAGRCDEALAEIQRWEVSADPIGIPDADRQAVDKRKARLG